MKLTPRQAEVSALVSRGLSNKEIAHELKISSYTVRDHLAKVFKALNLKNRWELIRKVKP